MNPSGSRLDRDPSRLASDKAVYSGFVLIGTAAWLLGAFSADFDSHWNQLTYHLDYSQGFIRRALVGHLFHVAGIAVTADSVFHFSLIIHLLTLIACVLLFKAHLPSIDPRVRTAFLLLFAISPATFMHYGRDLGRHDQLLVLLAITCVLLIRTERFLFASFLSAVAVLIHELFVLTGLPILVAYTLIRIEGATNPKASLLHGAAIPASSLLALLAVLFRGGAEVDASHALNPMAAQMLLDFGIADHIRFTAREYSDPLVYGRLLIAAAYLLPLALVYQRLGRYRRAWREALLLSSPATILPLFIVGVDFERWIAFLVVNGLLIVAVFGLQRMKTGDLLSRRSRLLFGAHLSFTLLGPLPSRGPFILLSVLFERLKAIV